MQRLATRIALLVGPLLLASFSAHALQFRAYVASYGSDTNGCGVSTPCRLLPAALNTVLDGGEVWMLDSANFNQTTVVVNKNVSILAVPGQIGSIASVGSVPALSVSGAFVVRLRNVVIANNANNPGTDGIVVSGGAHLFVEKSFFAVAARGIVASGNSVVNVNETTFTGGSSGVALQGAVADVSNCRISGGGDYGVIIDGSVAGSTSFASLSDSSVTDGWGGVASFGSASVASTMRVSVTRTTFSNLTWGVVGQTSGASQTIVSTVGGSSFSRIAGTAMYASGTGASSESIGNNQVRQVGSATSGTFATVGSI